MASSITLFQWHHTPLKAKGPPFAVDQTELESLFPTPKWSVSLLERLPFDMSDNSKFRDCATFNELVFLVEKKG
jgi:hypothetical protein